MRQDPAIVFRSTFIASSEKNALTAVVISYEPNQGSNHLGPPSVLCLSGYAYQMVQLVARRTISHTDLIFILGEPK